MANRNPISVGEWYHCFNRGVDKRRVFQTKEDYERFLALMYVCNGMKSNIVSDRRDTSLFSILSDEKLERGKLLVDIGAYALMPNHVHFAVRETCEGGIASFMRKLFTGYTMFFNRKNERSGALFEGAYKSKHIHDDAYFKQVIAYIHLNPAELFEKQWKEGVAHIGRLKENLLSYPYASTKDFFGGKRLEGKIVSSVADLYDKLPTISNILIDAREYYQENTANGGGETSRRVIRAR